MRFQQSANAVQSLDDAFNLGAHVTTIALEVDGVLSDYYETLYEGLLCEDPSLLSQKSPDDFLLDLAEGSFPEDSMLSRAIRIASRVPLFYHTLRPCDRATTEQIHRLDDAMDGSDVVGYAIARRPDLIGAGPAIARDAWVATHDWVSHLGLRHFIGILANLQREQKAQKLHELKVDFHLSAVPSQVELLRGQGIRAYLFDRSWNRSVDSLWRVDNLEEFVDIALEYLPEEEVAA